MGSRRGPTSRLCPRALFRLITIAAKAPQRAVLTVRLFDTGQLPGFEAQRQSSSTVKAFSLSVVFSLPFPISEIEGTFLDGATPGFVGAGQD